MRWPSEKSRTLTSDFSVTAHGCLQGGTDGKLKPETLRLMVPKPSTLSSLPFRGMAESRTTYMCTYIYTHADLCTNIYIYYTHISVHRYIHICIIYIYTCLGICARVCWCYVSATIMNRVSLHLNIYICMYVYMHDIWFMIYVYVYAHIQKHTQIAMFV